MVAAVYYTDSKLHSAADDFHIFLIIRKLFRVNIEIHILLFSRIQKDFRKVLLLLKLLSNVQLLIYGRIEDKS